MAFSGDNVPPSPIISDSPIELLRSPIPDSPNTPSSVSSISIITHSSLGGSWSNMSHISQSRTPTEIDIEIEPISRHPAYYIPSGDVVFLAGAQLFRVHRYFFVRESVKFRDMLSVVATNGIELSGSSDSRAIHLPDVTKEEFESFLWIFYSDEYEFEAPLKKWSAILRLAHMWQFPKVKLLATRKMDKLDIEPVDKAVMARDYEVDPSYGWLEQAYAALGDRETSISRSEGARLGLDVVVHLADLRERVLREKFDEEKRSLQQTEAVYDPPPDDSAYISPVPHNQLTLIHEEAAKSPLKQFDHLQAHDRPPSSEYNTLADDLADLMDKANLTPEEIYPPAKGKKTKGKKVAASDGYRKYTDVW